MANNLGDLTNNLISNWFCFKRRYIIGDTCYPANPIKNIFVKARKDGGRGFDIPCLFIKLAPSILCRVNSPEHIHNIKGLIGQDVAYESEGDSPNLKKLIKFWIDYENRNIIDRVYIQKKYWYIGDGILLDEDFNPLIIASVRCQEIYADSNNKTSLRFVLANPCLRISPMILFCSELNFLKKWILSEVTYSVLLCDSPKALSPFGPVWDLGGHEPITLSIGKEIDDFILKVRKPTLVENINAVINKWFASDKVEKELNNLL